MALGTLWVMISRRARVTRSLNPHPHAGTRREHPRCFA